MKRDACLLGFLATSGQILLLRELVTAFGGTELFIGTALFGWLLWVAVGALVGGARRRWNAQLLFAVGALLLPLSLVGVRLLPLLVTTTVGEMIPLTVAAPLSAVVMAPVGLLCGLFFPIIALQGRNTGESIASVYLYEGLGAFAAGVVTVVLIGLSVGNLGTALLVGAVVGAMASLRPGAYRVLLWGASAALILLLSTTRFGALLDRMCDRTKYSGYLVERSFDTPYGHQTLLVRDSTTVLLTDNAVEAVYPDLERAEKLLIPPLAYNPTASSVLIVGRTEFGVEQLAAQIPGVGLTAVDPRGQLTRQPEAGRLSAVVRIDDDPVAFFSRPSTGLFDVIVISLGRLDSYRATRLVTPDFLELAGRRLSRGGILLLATSFDTDRYVSSETGVSLALISHTVERVFAHTAVWPGNATLILASETNNFGLSVDSMLARIAGLPYRPQYVSEYYLPERLGDFKRQRLQEALATTSDANSIERPVLATAETWRRAKASELDRELSDLLLRRPLWLLVIPLALVAFLAWAFRGRRAGRAGLFLYFAAGAVSLSLELVSFYLFQSTAGSLHLHLAVLIGVFMLGLSLGTWLGSRTVGLGVGWLSAATLMAASAVFGLTWRTVDFRLALIYHALFLLLVALATGALFVAATRHYYADFPQRSRGTGYALELAGSAGGALLTAAILLPTVGIAGILIAIVSISLCSLVATSLRRS